MNRKEKIEEFIKYIKGLEEDSFAPFKLIKIAGNFFQVKSNSARHYVEDAVSWGYLRVNNFRLEITDKVKTKTSVKDIIPKDKVKYLEAKVDKLEAKLDIFITKLEEVLK